MEDHLVYADYILFSLDRKLLMHPAEDYAKLQLFHRGGNRRLVHNMWSYQLHKNCSAILHHVLCSEAMKQGLVHLNIIWWFDLDWLYHSLLIWDTEYCIDILNNRKTLKVINLGRCKVSLLMKKSHLLLSD